MKVGRAVADRHPFLKTSDCIGTCNDIRRFRAPARMLDQIATSDQRSCSLILPHLFSLTICGKPRGAESSQSKSRISLWADTRRIARRFHQKKSTRPVRFESTE
jgi:hypothetical protein